MNKEDLAILLSKRVELEYLEEVESSFDYEDDDEYGAEGREFFRRLADEVWRKLKESGCD